MSLRMLLVSCLTLVAAAVSFAETPLTVMSFNLRYGTAMDGENAWPKRKDILIDTIRQANPDILGTQECLQLQAEYIAGKFPEYQWIGIGREAGGKGEMTAVFYRKDLLEAAESGHFWLSETPDVPASISWNSACTRMVTWIKFAHRASGKNFFYFNTHFDHKSEEARRQSALMLEKRFAAIDPNTPLILTGDFNAAAESSDAYATLIGAGMKDAWLAAEKHDGPGTTWGEFKAPAPNALGRIDWILFRGPVQVKNCRIITYNQDGRYPSDHYPVTAALKLFD